MGERRHAFAVEFEMFGVPSNVVITDTVLSPPFAT
jgi:hypothetical protein